MTRRAAILIALLLGTLVVAGCSSLRFPGVYRIDIEQGNLVDDDMLSRLKPGMTEAQVRFVMGSPQMADPFVPGRWVYGYRLRRGSGEVIENRVILWFTDGKLTRWEGKGVPESVRLHIDTSKIGKGSNAAATSTQDNGAPSASDSAQLPGTTPGY